MCRWLAYAGEPVQPARLVLETEHSLVAQARSSPLGSETVNGDGFGLGWYRSRGPAERPALFRSIEPAWYDENLLEISSAIESPLFFAHVRAAAGPPIQQSNCHPFRFENWLFMHNGSISSFTLIRRDLMLSIDAELFPRVEGTTDSEVIFYLALTLGLREDPVSAMEATVRRIEEVGRAHGIKHPLLATFAVSDGSTLWVFRYSSDGASPTLFHSVEPSTLRAMYPDAEPPRGFGAQARMVVSEPLVSLPGAFVEVPESTALILEESGYRHERFMR